MNKTFYTLLKKKILEKKIYTGTIIQGCVKKITEKHVVVDVGLKSEGLINKLEFYDKNKKLEININDHVDVLIENLETTDGSIQLSREKIKKIHSWDKLEKLHLQNETIKGKVINRVKGGFIVEAENIKSFLPGSLAEVRPLKDYDKLDGKTFDFKILKLNKKTNNIVLSRKEVLLEETTGIDKNIIFNNLHKNQIVSGIVKNIADYGVFIDLGGIDGLLHITDIFWGRLKHPSLLFTTGQMINIKIIKLDQQKNRVFLGLKQLSEDPWLNINKKYIKNTKITGIVTNVFDYGCFVELEQGVEGLIHTTEIDWMNKNTNPTKIVKQHQQINVIVLSVDEKKRQIFLDLKQCNENPWKKFNQEYKVGDKIFGKIKTITPFGIFIELNTSIDGLMHLNDISWLNEPLEEIKKYRKGQLIEIIILSIEVKKERITLGIKQLTKNPIEGIIKNTNQKNTILSLNNEIDGMLTQQN